MGQSGSGKTVLMSLMAGLDLPSKGRIIFKGTGLDQVNLDKFRSNNIGMIFHQFSLFRNYTALENVIIPLEQSNYPTELREKRALEVLLKMGINQDRVNKKVSFLSESEQQRTAVARAIASKPELILADEPTGISDSDTGKEIMNVLLNLAHNENYCILVFTRLKDIADYADEVWGIKDGKLMPIVQKEPERAYTFSMRLS
jgi:putative ABC transport system ATP-binding protein